MGFSLIKNDEDKKNKKPPPLPPRGDISEDSMEDMVSDFEVKSDNTGMTPKSRKFTPKTHTKNLSVDTDKILQKANQMIDTSMVSDSGDTRANSLPLPDPLKPTIKISETYLKQFKQR